MFCIQNPRRAVANVLLFFLSLLAFVASQGTATNTTSASTCETETLELNSNQEVSAATTALLTSTKDDILADFSGFCRIVALRCDVNLDEYSTDLKDACEQNGGQLYTTTFELACETDTVSPIEIPGTVALQNLPGCLGASCDLDNLPPSILQFQEDIVAQINTEVNAVLGDMVVCVMDSSEDNADGDGSSSSCQSSAGLWSIMLVCGSSLIFASI